tara:strand:+ start:8521 stop:8910 length:390 start_codon:yes stop_codon:yes gene_type:complete
MAKKIKLTEKTLTRMIKNILEQELDDETIIDIENEELPQEVDLTDIESELEQILSPEEILGLMEEQIRQLQDRVQYVEELNADVLEFTSFLMSDLERSPELDLKKSKQKLRALETRAGREIFWLKSRRL